MLNVTVFGEKAFCSIDKGLEDVDIQENSHKGSEVVEEKSSIGQKTFLKNFPSEQKLL